MRKHILLCHPSDRMAVVHVFTNTHMRYLVHLGSYFITTSCILLALVRAVHFMTPAVLSAVKCHCCFKLYACGACATLARCSALDLQFCLAASLFDGP